MTSPTYILGGARTPMADYAGKFKDVSAIELGAIASRAAMERTGVAPELVDHVVFGNVLHTSSDAIYGARHVALKAGAADRGARADGQPAVRLGPAGGRHGRADDSPRRGRRRARRRHGEHEPGAARHPRAARGLRLGQGSSRTRCGPACSTRTAGARWRRRRRTARRSTASPARSRIGTRSAASSSPTQAWTAGRFAEEVVPVEIKARKGVELFDRTTITCVRTRRSRGWRSCRRRSAKNGCVTAGNASGIVDGAAAMLLASEKAVEKHGPRAARPPDALGHGRCRADADGHGAGARDAHGARQGRAHARRHRSDRGQRSVRRAVSRRREGARASIATRSTSTAVRSRSAIRSA